MALGLTAQANIAYKNLLGKSLTYLINGVNVESTGIFFNVTSNNIWLAQLPSSPTQAVASGYAVQVTGSMSYIASANNYAYSLTWPATPPSGIDPLTLTSFAYNSGSLTGINAGNVITNAISDSYGSAYSIYISGVSGGQIFPSDARNWVYQYNSGIYFQENAAATPNPSTASVYVYIGPTLQSQPNTPFTLTSSTSQVSVGGLNSGASFNNVTTNNILLNMLYPSTQPNITAFSMSGVSTAYEVGSGILSGSYNLNWAISNTASLVNTNLYIIGYNNTVIGPLSNVGPYSYSFGSSLTYNTPRISTWTMSVLTNTGIRITSTFSIGWYYAMYYGSSTQSLLLTPNTSLQNNKLSTIASGSYTLNGATGSYKYIAIPDLYPTISSITWNGMPIALADSADGYTWSANNLNYNFLLNYANINGITYSYKIYRSKYMLAATMSNVIIS